MSCPGAGVLWPCVCGVRGVRDSRWTRRRWTARLEAAGFQSAGGDESGRRTWEWQGRRRPSLGGGAGFRCAARLLVLGRGGQPAPAGSNATQIAEKISCFLAEASRGGRAGRAVALWRRRAGCGYRVAGRANTLPATVKTIAVPAFENRTSTYRIEQRLTSAVVHELLVDTRYRVVSNPADGDAVLQGRC